MYGLCYSTQEDRQSYSQGVSRGESESVEQTEPGEEERCQQEGILTPPYLES